jgi:hypothetical protein
MQIVQGDEIPVDANASNVRGGELRKRILLTGEMNTPGNFKLGLFYQTGDFSSPRHRHNFDQFRFQLEGDCDFDRDGTMKPGVIGYFPEGAPYGPQSSKESNLVAVVQFGGPSGSGFMAQEQVDAIYEEMKQFGSFDQGVYRRNEGVPGKKNMDSFHAVWEYANKRPLVYPKPQYAKPILMNPDAVRWLPLADSPGVEEKSLGTFTDCKIRCGRYKLAPGSSFTGTGRGLYLVLYGNGSLEGRPMRRHTALYLKDGEQATFKADETTEIQLLGLPNEALIGTQPLVADGSEDSVAA